MTRIIPSRPTVAAALFAAAFFFLSGCTEAERRGYSSIPHNTPAQWEYAPYGEIHN